nr:GNAT family protein [Saccharomonospora saliphila]
MRDPGPPGRSYTERLVLRPVTAADVDAVTAYLSRPDVCRYLLHPPRTREEVAARLAVREQQTRLSADGDGLRFAVVTRSDDALIGELHLTVYAAATATVEIGWIFSPHVAGNGYATEAARELLRSTFADRGAHRVVARLHPDNTASVRVCERLGMRHEALHRRDIWVKGGWEDTSVYAVLRDEWCGPGTA